ncbi:MAG: S1/P1 nuclease [Bdellovibrionota bacterium]
MTRSLVLTLVLLFSVGAHAWGKRGHTIVCETAGNLAAGVDKKNEFLAAHSFDLGFYCNVPDLVWKHPKTYQLEKNNHFMDLEIFDRALGEKTKDAFSLDRVAFDKAHPEVKEEAGRSYWRVRELEVSLTALTDALKKGIGDTDKRHDVQLDWLVLAGAIGHYIGDLSQPLHVTENYDGQMSDQKGIHSFYEEAIVDELSRVPSPNALAGDVGREAAKEWPGYQKRVAKLSTLELMMDLAKTSNAGLAKLLAADKKTGRSDVSKASKAHREQIVSRLANGAMTLAELWKRNTGMDFDEKKFYRFDGAPAFRAVPSAAASKD